MKTIITFALIFLSILTFAQKSEVIADSTQKKNDLYTKSLEWVTITWKSAKNVIEMNDKDNGVLIVKGGLSTYPKSLGMKAGNGTTMVTLTIRVKDGKVKIEFSDLKYVDINFTYISLGEGQDKGIYRKWQESCYTEEEDLIQSFKSKVLSRTNDF